MMLLSIALGLVTAVVVAFLWGAMKVGSFSTVEEDGTTTRLGCFFHIGWGWLFAVVFGGILGVVNYFSTQEFANPNLYWVLVFLSVGLLAALIVWWTDDGSSTGELLTFMVLSLVVGWTALGPAVAAVIEHCELSDFRKSLVLMAAIIMCIGTDAAIGYDCASNQARERRLDAKEAEEDGDTEAAAAANKRAKSYENVATAILVVALAATALLVGFGINWSALKKPAPEPEIEEPAPEPVREAWYTFGVLELLEDDDETNNANFGADLYKEDMTPEEAWEAVKWASYRNPINGITTVYYNDAVSGNRYLEEYYLAHDNDTDAINEAIRSYVLGENKYDNTGYKRLLDSMFGFVEMNQPKLELYTSKELKKMGVTISDQFYCNPFSNFYDQDGVEIPASIVYDCGTGEEEVYLHLTYKVKYNSVEWWVHMGCGGQLANVSGKLRVDAEKNPNNKPTTPRNTTTPTTTTTPATPQTTITPQTATTPVVQVPKDITKGTPAGVTVGPRLDDDTNGDPYWSSKDTSSHSSHLTDAQYRGEVDNLNKVNEVSREGGTPNTPSTPARDNDTKVDNPGDGGTAQNGYIGIDPQTPVNEIIHEVDNGKSYNNTVETAEGPVDLSDI